FEELGVKTQRFAQVVFGVLIIEDLVVILLMVLLSTVAVTQQFEGGEMIFTVGKLVFFLVLWFLAGIFLIPTLLRKAKKLLDEETLLVLSVALCFVMVVVATMAGFSAELGAFIMGSILAETTSAEKIEHLIKPVKNLFGAVFFISVGMLIDPALIIQYAVPVIIITLTMFFGKIISTTGGALMSGQPLKQALQVGMSMAQVGEFAFIVAALGMTLGVTSDFLFPVAVGVSAISTFTTPYMIKFSPTLYSWIEKIIPEKWLTRLENYTESAQSIKTENRWKTVFGEYMTIMATNGIIMLAILLICLHGVFPFIDKYLPHNLLDSVIKLVIVLALISPFLMAFIRKKPKNLAYKGLWTVRRYNHGPLLIIEIVRNVIGLGILSFLIIHLFPNIIAFFVVLLLVVVVLVLFNRQIKSFYNRFETHFLKNLNAREETTTANELLHHDNLSALWNAHLVELEVQPAAEYVGKTIAKLNWRKEFGINVAYIKRSEKMIYAPQKDDLIFPYDKLGIIATDEQLEQFKPAFESEEQILTDENAQDVVFQSIIISEANKLYGQTIAEADIREKTNGMVIGIERGGNRIINPKADTRFEKSDIVWIVGDRKKIQALNAA
ncbi:MAG: cation:proton antiporter, partial [Paludibacter sp.]|nr:cation:proton antiporter [Paludibacter sp.]